MLKNEASELCCKINDSGRNSIPVMPPMLAEAMAYVPFQQYKNIYKNEEGFLRGTIFPELDKPFLKAGGDLSE